MIAELNTNKGQHSRSHMLCMTAAAYLQLLLLARAAVLGFVTSLAGAGNPMGAAQAIQAAADTVLYFVDTKVSGTG
jgi:hypothetical protein